MMEGVSGKDGLLLWVQRQTAGFSKYGVDIKNFSTSWQNGMAFCALLAKFRPKAIDMESLNPEDAMANVSLALKVADEWFGVEPLFDAEDIVDTKKPDEKIIICYISFLFRAIAELTKQDALAKAIHKALDITRRHDGWIADYESRAEEHTSWVKASEEKWGGEVAGNNLESIRATLNAFYEYRSSEKPTEAAKITALDGLCNTIRASQRNNNRPAYEPASAITVDALKTAWKGLEEAENAYEARVRERYARFQVLTNTLATLHAKASKLAQWIAKQEDLFAAAEYGHSWVEAETLIEGYKGFEDQLQHQKATLATLRTWTTEGGMEEHADQPAAVAALDDVQAKMDAMVANGQTYHDELQASLDKFKKLAVDIKHYHSKATEFEFACDEVSDELATPVPTTSMAAVQAVIDSFNGGVAAKKAAVDARLAELLELAAPLKEAGADAFKRFSTESLQGTIDALAEAMAARDAQLKAAMAEENEKDEMRKKFAELATDLKSYCTSKQAEVGALPGSLEEQMAALEALKAEYTSTSEARIGAVKEAADALAAKGVVNNEHTPETSNSLSAMWAELAKVYEGALESLQGQLMAAKSGELTPEQIKEIREVFEFFDEDKDDGLSPKEFHSCATGIGLMLTDEEAAEKFATIDLSGDGLIDIDEFSTFMIEQLKEPGHDRHDVAKAFADLAGDGCPEENCITPAQINRFFQEDEDKEYMLSRMPDGPDGTKNFDAFVSEVFTR